jgi:alpha(1,3/1,4) fucosyltransferase
MKCIKVNFVDFWNGFEKTDNYFYHLLSKNYDVIIDNVDPDVLFFSVDYSLKQESMKYKDHRCLKVFYTGESVSPNFDFDTPIRFSNFQANYSIAKCDISFSFDENSDKNFRLPLWVLHIDWFNAGGYGDNPSFLIPFDSISENRFIRTKKTKFCAAVFSNPTQERLMLLNKISGYKKVDGYGSIFGNHSDGELSKYEILKNYKFSICPENKISDGYFTEKLFHAKIAGTIPIYRYDKRDKIDFNEKCFINLNDFEDEKELVEFVKKLDTNEDLYYDIFNEPLFLSSDIVRTKFGPENVLRFFKENILC